MFERVVFIIAFAGLLSLPIIVPIFLYRLSKVESMMEKIFDFFENLIIEIDK